MFFTKVSRILIAATLVLGSLVQLGHLLHSTVIPLTFLIADSSDKPAWYRSAVISPHFYFADEIAHIRRTVPPESIVYLTDSKPIFSWRPVMQYFLFPRQVIICPDSNFKHCVANNPSDMPVPINFPGFPMFQEVHEGYVFQPFPNQSSYGIYFRDY